MLTHDETRVRETLEKERRRRRLSLHENRWRIEEETMEEGVGCVKRLKAPSIDVDRADRGLSRGLLRHFT